MKPFLLALALALGLGGCVVYVQVPKSDQTHTTQQSVQIVMPTPEPATPSPETVAEEPEPTVVTKVVTKVVGEPCERFQWPEIAAAPPQAEFVTDVLTKRDAFSPEQINDILLDYIYALRTYMNVGYSGLRDGYLAYLDRCGYEEDIQLPESIYPSSR